MTPDALVHSLLFRYAVKKFDASRKIPADAWASLEQSLLQAPSSFGLQPWKFFVVGNPELRAKLPPLSWGQTQPVEASHFVVLAHRETLTAADVERWIRCSAEARGMTYESLAGFGKVVQGSVDGAVASGQAANWNARQVYIALGFLMLGAAALGIDSCPMEGIDKTGYDEALGLKGTGYTTTVACALGYRAADDKYATQPKARFPLKEVVVHL
jgi:nitroreductase